MNKKYSILLLSTFFLVSTASFASESKATRKPGSVRQQESWQKKQTETADQTLDQNDFPPLKATTKTIPAPVDNTTTELPTESAPQNQTIPQDTVVQPTVTPPMPTVTAPVNEVNSTLPVPTIPTASTTSDATPSTPAPVNDVAAQAPLANLPIETIRIKTGDAWYVWNLGKTADVVLSNKMSALEPHQRLQSRNDETAQTVITSAVNKLTEKPAENTVAFVALAQQKGLYVAKTNRRNLRDNKLKPHAKFQTEALYQAYTKSIADLNAVIAERIQAIQAEYTQGIEEINKTHQAIDNTYALGADLNINLSELQQSNAATINKLLKDRAEDQLSDNEEEYEQFTPANELITFNKIATISRADFSHKVPSKNGRKTLAAQLLLQTKQTEVSSQNQ